MISPILDIEDPIEKAYNLEISSPGIDRPLVRLNDFARWAGHTAKLETHGMVDGRRRFKGVITSVDGQSIHFHRPEAAGDEPDAFSIQMSDIKEARLILTDSLIEEALKRDKALRKANNLEIEHEEQSNGN